MWKTVIFIPILFFMWSHHIKPFVVPKHFLKSIIPFFLWFVKYNCSVSHSILFIILCFYKLKKLAVLLVGTLYCWCFLFLRSLIIDTSQYPKINHSMYSNVYRYGNNVLFTVHPLTLYHIYTRNWLILYELQLSNLEMLFLHVKPFYVKVKFINI